jgi:hypothetical protein
MTWVDKRSLKYWLDSFCIGVFSRQRTIVSISRWDRGIG